MVTYPHTHIQEYEIVITIKHHREYIQNRTATIKANTITSTISSLVMPLLPTSARSNSHKSEYDCLCHDPSTFTLNKMLMIMAADACVGTGCLYWCWLLALVFKRVKNCNSHESGQILLENKGAQQTTSFSFSSCSINCYGQWLD